MTVVQLPEDLSLKGFFCFFFGGRWIIVIFDWFWWVVVSVATMFFFVGRVLLATSQENKGRCWRCCRVSLRKIIGITGGYRVPSNGQCNSPDRFIPLKSGWCGNKWATNLASCCFFAAFYRITLFWSSKRRVVFCNVIEKNKQDFHLLEFPSNFTTIWTIVEEDLRWRHLTFIERKFLNIHC